MVHRARGRRPNNSKHESFKHAVLERAREEVFFDFEPTLLAEPPSVSWCRWIP